ncbi:MAG: IclR family transcriptional regulator [Peptoniphilus sp.]|nr:IclR family transcriptional regulator [Peptoniphilus sp.]MDD7362867.1 IclR family transcriptional regulator [Bacillota bacterium]MDY6044892.1 IclR family transcriptional regulator [Peptoniphilus sp.]
MAKKTDYTVPMVEKALQILRFLLENNGTHGIGDIAGRLDIPKTSVFKILYTLESERFVAKDAEDRYSLGLGFIPYDAEVKNRWDFTKVTRPIMERGAALSGESLNLGILADDTIVMLDTVPGEEFFIIRHLIPVAPLYCSSIGKIFLAEFEDEALAEYFERHELTPRTISTLTDPDALRKNLAEIEETGTAHDWEEYEYGLTCMAKGIYSEGELIAGISLSGPTSRLKHKGLDSLEAILADVADALAAEPGLGKLLSL